MLVNGSIPIWLPTPHELCIEINIATASSCWSFTEMWPTSVCTTLFTIFSTTIISYSAFSCHVTSPLLCLLIRTPCLMILCKWFRGYMFFFVRPPPRPPPHFERLALDIVHMNYWCAKMVSAYHADSLYFYAPDEVCVQCQAATNNSNANMKADGGRWLWDCGSDRFVFDHIHHLYRPEE